MTITPINPVLTAALKGANGSASKATTSLLKAICVNERDSDLGLLIEALLYGSDRLVRNNEDLEAARNMPDVLREKAEKIAENMSLEIEYELEGAA